MTADLEREMAQALRALVDMLDSKQRGLKASVLVPDNDCGCDCCDVDGDVIYQVKEVIADILESEAAINARRALSRWEWAR